MKKKFTLTIEESVKARAKRFANAHDTSVSQIIEQYLDSITREETDFEPKTGSWTDRLYGAGKLPKEYKNKNYKQIKEKELLKKYG